jgi:ABC-2 type transport system ATP-binding protein
MEYAVNASHLTKAFGRLIALDGLSLKVCKGESYGLLGPNGSGKTTLIRILVGILKPTNGEVAVMGRRMPDKAVLHQIGYMTQTSALYQDLSVLENLLFFARIYGLTDRKRLDEVLRLVGLHDRAHSVVSTLSGGMKQRVSLACALIHRPQLLLLDEPTVGVDPQLRVQFWHYFRELNQQGVTIVISSHVMDEAERCDRLGLLRQGRLLAEGSPQELRERAGRSSLEEAFLAFAEVDHERV